MFRLTPIAVMLAIAGGACNPAVAQTYPNKAIRLVVTQAPGGGNDTIARMVAQKISGPLKQQVAVDNRPGAGGLIAAELVSKAPPDGYTLLLSNVATMAVIPSIQKKVPYDPVKDFEHISLIATAPMLVVVHPSLPVNSIKQLIALSKAKPNQLNYASNGVGSSTHLATEMFKLQTGAQMVHVPYKGLSLAMSDLISGQVQVMFSSAVAMMPHVKARRLRAIAITSSKRSESVPDIPTVAEAAGLKDFEVGSWYGVSAPAGTPKAVVDQLNREIVAATKSKDITDRLEFEGVIPVGSSPAEYAAYVKRELDHVGKVVKASGDAFGQGE
jgi:tripartite-type tricarboxylate transporter receptor subunit TctC